ncbi:MAG: peptide chain release factor 1 [Bacilli bacterium]|nr:peptide chain release factor 1 [Bacilli bacterium]
MIERLEMIEKQYNLINEELQKPEVISDIKKMTELMKKLSSYSEVVNKFHEYKKNKKALNDLEALSLDEDEEIRALAEIELEEENKNKERIEEELKVLLLPKDPNDEKNVIVEIRGAAGGDEANIFAGDLFRMYSRYAEEKGWKIEVLDTDESEMGGFSQIQFVLNGKEVYSHMKYESGSHRVQRVPETESGGRIHTSTATVLIMPEVEDLELELDLNDVRVDTFCASGHGGQSVNTTKSAVRVTHLPTGLVASCQDGKSQHENKANALKVLKARIYESMMEEKQEKEGKERLAKIGHGDRSEKIRTYNYPQNRVTDHRIGFTIQQLDRVMEGKLEPVINALIEEDHKRKLAENL